ncbi:hypothetical protein [Alteromonas sp. A079]|uniref:hypothetical protein n=1 Tax=Alteromonas sp. A079 TaxID=3410268 RepID=UPI003B9E5596
MKVEDLNHIHTPAELRELNEKLVVQLENANSSDYAELNLLLAQRDSLINTYLEVLQPDDKKAFATLELEVNNSLKDLAQSLLETSKEDIIQFVRAKAAVKKYK